MELLKQKILSKYNDKPNGSTGQDQLTELLNLCRSDLGEILDKLRQKIMKDAVVEDQLRAELIEQGRKMNEMRQAHERAVTMITHQLTSKFDSELLKADSEFKGQVAKLLAEVNQKENRIRQLEKNEKKAIAERDKH